MIIKKFSKKILRYPFHLLIIILLITGLFFHKAFYSKTPLSVDFSMEQMFPEESLEREKYQAFVSEFNRSDDKIILAYKCDNPLSRKNINIIKSLSEALEIEGVEEIISLGTIEYFDDYLSNNEWRQQIDLLLNHPIYPNLIISEDKKIAAIIIDINDDIDNQLERTNLLLSIKNIIEITDWEWYETGIPVLRTRFIELMNQERAIFLPIAFIVSIIILFLIFRQIKCILIPILAISANLIWIAGIMAYLDISINIVSYLTFNLLVIIGVSNAIHFLARYHEELSLGLDKTEALENVIEKIGGALFLTSFTTSVGFFSLSFTNIRIIQEFGFIVGLGVLLMFILTIAILSISLNFIKIPEKKHINRLIKNKNFSLSTQIFKCNKKYPQTILFFSGIVCIVAIYGLLKIDYNAYLIEDVKPGNPIYDNMKFVEKKIGGILPLEIIIDAKDENKILNSDVLNKINIFKDKILTISEINTAITPADYLMLINEEIGTSTREVPKTYKDALSLIFTYEDLLGEEFNSVNQNYSKARISCRISDITYQRYLEIKKIISSIGKKTFDDNIEVIVTGSTILSLSTNHYLVKNLFTSFFIAFTIIFISIVILFRSFRLSLISILPNIIPLMFAGGLMGILGIKLRPTTAMTFSIALGIAVDNTIHFLARFRQEYKLCHSYNESISRTLRSTGKAIINTGLILALGFFVLYFSDFVPNHEFGLLATIIIIVAVSGSLILLPILIMLIKPKLRFDMQK